MIEKIKELCKKYREIILYLVFGVLTTLVGWIVYFAVLFIMKKAMGIPSDVTDGGRYLVAYTVAQVIQWIAAVLFAFFTNRKWVFTDADKNAPMLPQLGTFALGRVLTFGLDYIVTYFGGMGLAALLPMLNSVDFIGREWNINEIAAKVVAAVIVIIGNYVFSKLLVFRKKNKDE